MKLKKLNSFTVITKFTHWMTKRLILIALITNGLSTAKLSAQNIDDSSTIKGYNNFSLLYRNIDIEDYNMNGFGFEWIHGFGVSEQLPIYLETGLGLNMALKDEGSGSWAGYGYIDVPLNCTYRYTLPHSAFNISPYLGFELKGNIVGSLDVTEPMEWFSEDYNFKRFQLGWHVGVGLNYKKLHASIGYGTDLIKIAKKTGQRTGAVGDSTASLAHVNCKA